MINRDAEFWNERYAGDGYSYGEAPNAFLASLKDTFSAGQTALVPADGEGRNGVWLAGLGLDVTTLDHSEVGVGKARTLAEKYGVGINAVLTDVFEWDWPEGAFDHIVLIYFHLPEEGRKKLHALAAKALAPGGRVIIEAFTPKNLVYRAENPAVGGPPEEHLLFTAEMLAADFNGLTPLLLEERETVLKEGRFHDGKGAVVNAIFQKEG